MRCERITAYAAKAECVQGNKKTGLWLQHITFHAHRNLIYVVYNVHSRQAEREVFGNESNKNLFSYLAALLRLLPPLPTFLFYLVYRCT